MALTDPIDMEYRGGPLAGTKKRWKGRTVDPPEVIRPADHAGEPGTYHLLNRHPAAARIPSRYVYLWYRDELRRQPAQAPNPPGVRPAVPDRMHFPPIR